MKYLTFITCLIISFSTYGQQPIHNFTLTNVVDGSTVSLDGYPSCTGLVAIFTSNECAFDNYYTSRIKSLTDRYAGKIQVILINSYLEPEESPEKMAAKYKGWNLHIPYLADKDQTAMDCMGAKKSPEAFLLKNIGNKYVLVYSGAIDDNAQVPSDVKENYLTNTIDKLIASQKIEVASVRAVGCSIRRK
jgi:AhpC/TSA family